MSAPLCLENICRINLLFRLEEYPVQQLLLLPLSVRRDLSLGLPSADILHYEAVGLFHDIDTAGVVESHRRELLSVALGTHNELSKLFVPSIFSALVPEKQTEELSNSIFEHVRESFSSLPFTAAEVHGSTALLPNRFCLYFSLDDGIHFHDPCFESLKLLLQYCHFLTAPKEVKIDVNEFLSSPLWAKFSNALEEKCDVVVQDPVLPFLQSFLSRVEKIELGTIKRFEEFRIEFGGDGMEFVPIPIDFSTARAASYTLLYNILTIRQPCLKHIKIWHAQGSH